MKTNNLTYKATKTDGKYDYIIKIRLNDECKNGREDFAITGEIYDKGKRGDRYMHSCGAIGDKIASLFPEFQIFEDLHLCTYAGVPMSAIENGFYHMQQGNDFKKYLRLTDSEADILKTAENKDYFEYLICKLNIPARWKEEADKAIGILEGYTGDSFESKATRFWTPLSKEKMQEFKDKEDSGFYSIKNIEIRKTEAFEAEKKKKIDKLTNEYAREVSKLEKKLSIEIALVEAGLLSDNFIYYSHKNELVFNYSNYYKITPEVLDKVLSILDMNKLPENITIIR